LIILYLIPPLAISWFILDFGIISSCRRKEN